MFGIGGTELVIIIIFGFLIFGPDRLPAMGRTIGRALRQFQQAQDQMNKMVKTEIYDPINEAAKAPEKKQGPKKKTTAASSSTKPETFAEKKARLAAEAQAKAQAKAAGEEPEPQADVIVVPEKPVGRSETFAEKKARLEAEKAAAAAKKEKGGAVVTTPASSKVRTASSSKKKAGASSSAKLYGLSPVAAKPASDTADSATADAEALQSTGKGDQA